MSGSFTFVRRLNRRYSARVADAEELLEGLTPPQREAATHVDGPLLIIAGAGSGKTRVITRRVALLLAGGISPWSILAITFTNKAAGEMKTRVAAVVERPLRDFGQLHQPWPLICTFHSLCLRILKHYATRIGLPDNFSIFDSADQTKLIKEAIKTLDLPTENFTPSTIHGTISNAKNQLMSPEDFASRAGDFYQKTVARVFTKYQQLLDQNNALDFDDLLLRAVRAFRDHPDILKELQERFRYILIDEYQDTNRAQYILAHALAQRYQNICVVGDPDQSIYAWRGADINNILDFEKDYPQAKVVRLEQNYRSTKRILRIASKLIANNGQRKDKTLWTENAEGEKARLLLCQDEHDEAAAVTSQLRTLHDKNGYDWDKMAIFYRTNALSRVMEDALRKAAVPYQIARGVEFYNRKEIKDALAYLRVVSNPSDELSLTRIVNVPTRGLSDATINQLSAFAIANGLSLWQALRRASAVPGVSPRAAKSARPFVEMVTTWRAMVYGSNPDAQPEEEPAQAATVASAPQTDSPDIAGLAAGTAEAIPEHEGLFGSMQADPFGASDPATLDAIDLDAGSSDTPEPLAPSAAPPTRSRTSVRDIAEAVIRQSGLEAHLKKIGGTELDELQNVQELISSAADFDKDNPQGSLDDFLAQISLVSDADHMKGTGGAVTLMTLHAAKGLEFPVVAMIGLEEGLLPFGRERENPEHTEEERRLCFVGITRAQERLILSKAARRMVRGVTDLTVPSPFLYEMPADDIESIDRTGSKSFIPQRFAGGRPQANKRGEQTSQESFHRPLSGEFSHLRRGQIVRHPIFGVGRIREIEEIGQRTRAVVQFNQVGIKTLYLDHARIEVVE